MDDRTITKPARRYIAKAVAYRGKWHAVYAFPGVTPHYVSAPLTEGGQTRHIDCQYDTASDAENAARAALLDALNNRPRAKQTAERYSLMSGDEFAAAVRDAGLTPTFAAYLLGVSTERFFQWVDETPDKHGRIIGPPHAARVLLAIWAAMPAAIDLAENLTDDVTTERKPRRETDSATD